MYDPEMRKYCPMRGNLGNCSPVGGFCMDAVSDEICKAVHNAYDHGFYDALKTLKEQEAVEPKVSSTEQRCGNCNKVIEMDGWIACPWCGKPIAWNEWWNKNDGQAVK